MTVGVRRMLSTPWGTAQTQDTLAPGITVVTTASHGGVLLAPQRNTVVHAAWRDARGHYEEDLEAYIVVLTFPELFSVEKVGRAHVSLKNWMPDEYEQVFGVKLSPADSFKRAEQVFAASVKDKLVTCAAWGYGNHLGGRMRVPKGWVGVCARLGGRWNPDPASERFFLVDEAEYDAHRRGHGLIVDPQRHPVWPALDQDTNGQPVMVFMWPTGKGRQESLLVSAALPHNREVGRLFCSVVGAPLWFAHRSVGTPAGTTLAAFATEEEALAALGFQLPPFAPTQVVSD